MEDSIAYKKADIRKIYREKRSLLHIEEKTELDNCITKNILNLPEFQTCKRLFTYVSIDDEVNTRDIIQIAFNYGKKVTVPKTHPSERVMQFYEITSLDDLKQGQHGLLEPDDVPEKRVTDMTEAVCLVPGLCFDGYGNRLGYGGGYYDRFLKDFSGVTVGLCRSVQLFEGKLPCEANDVPVMIIVTEYGHIRL